MNRSATLMFMCCLFLGVHAQNPLRRMDPDDWFRLDTVQEAWTMLGETRSMYSAQVWCNLGLLEMVAGSGGTAFGRVDDMRLVLDADGTSIGRSHNHGFNLGALHFMHRSRRYALGGRGFWNPHSKLVEFIPSTGEWELQPCTNQPVHVLKGLTWFDMQSESVLAIDPMDTDLPSENDCRIIHRLSMDALNWEEVGMLNKSVDVHFRDPATRSFDLPEYFVWLGLHKSVIVRKRDLSAVVTNAFNRSSYQPKAEFANGVGYLLTTVDSSRVRIIQRENLSDSGRVLMDIDVAAAFEAMEDETFDFVVPMDRHEMVVDVAVQNPTQWGLFAVAAIFLMGAGYLVGRQKQTVSIVAERNIPKSRPNGDEREANHDNFSTLTSRFIQAGTGEMDTAQLNDFLGLDMEQSEETVRARRAHCIRDINKEYKLVFGVDLIFRKKDEVDRRRTTYVIQPYSGSA